MDDAKPATTAELLADVEAKHAALAEATAAYVAAAHADGLTQLAVQAELMRIMVPPA